MPEIEAGHLRVPVTAETRQFEQAMQKAAEEGETFARRVVQSSQRGSQLFSFATRAMAVAAGVAAVEIGKTLVGAIGSAASSAVGFAKSGMAIAGRFDEMRITALTVGRAMGWTEEKILSGIRALEEGGIRYDVAAQAVAQFARNQIDLAHATDLARAAQGAAIVVGEDSSATLERFTYAISTGNSMLLKRLMITKTFAEMEEAAAKAIGKTRDQLTTQEMMQARVNGVIQESAMLMDVYDEAMMSPTKKLRSLTERVLPSMKAALTETLLPAWYTVVDTAYDFAQAITKACQEGGALYPILVQVGAAASLAADAFRNLVQPITDFLKPAAEAGHSFNLMGAQAQRGTRTVENAVIGMARRIVEISGNMLRWGAEMVGNLARGIIQGASTVLVGAMNAIGGILTSWLSPGSAPRIAPDIALWGLETFNEYLKGFSQASFDLLRGVQDPLQEALSRAVSAGEISQKRASGIFMGISGALTEAIARFQKTGEVGERVFEQIRLAGGETGEQIAELARRQFRLAAAVAKVQEAEQRLAAAREAREGAETAMNKAVREYNRLVATGASPKVVAAKRKEFEEAKTRVQMARQEEKDAAAQKKATEGQVGPLKAQAEQQERLLEALSRLSEERAEMVKVGVEVKGVEELKKMAEGISAAVEGIDIAPAKFDIESPLSAAIEDAKKELKKRLKGLFQPLLDEWEKTRATWEKRIGPVRETWKRFSTTVQEFYEKKIKPALEDFRDFIDEKLVPALERVRTFVEENVTPILAGLAAMIAAIVIPAFASWAAGAVAAAVATAAALVPVVLPILAIGVAVALLVKAWQSDWLGIQTTLTNVWNNTLKPALEKLGKWLGENVPKAIEALVKAWEDLNNSVKKIVAKLIKDIKEIPDQIEDLKKSIDATLGKIEKLWEEGWKKVAEALEKAWENIQNAVETGIEDAKKIISNAMSDFMQKGRDIANKIRDGINAAWGNVTGAIASGIARIGDKISELGETIRGFGRAIVERIGAGIRAATGIADAIAGKLSTLVASISSTTWTIVQAVGTTIVSRIGQGIKAAVGIVDAVAEKLRWLVTDLSAANAFAWVKSVGKKIVDAIIQGVKDNWQRFVNWLKNLIGGIFGASEPTDLLSPFRTAALAKRGQRIGRILAQSITAELGTGLQVGVRPFAMPEMPSVAGGATRVILAPVILSREEVEYAGELQWDRVFDALERRYGELGGL